MDQGIKPLTTGAQRAILRLNMERAMAKHTITVDTSQIPDDVYWEVMRLGLRRLRRSASIVAELHKISLNLVREMIRAKGLKVSSFSARELKSAATCYLKVNGTLFANLSWHLDHHWQE
jgi:hypothetical protein